MSNLGLKQLLFRNRIPIFVDCRRGRKPVNPHIEINRSFEEKNRMFLQQHKKRNLDLSDRDELPQQFKLRPKGVEKRIVTQEHKLAPLKNTNPPYFAYDSNQSYNTWYDPLFNPHLHEARNKVNPDEEPFNAIYSDSKSESSNEYTRTRNITNPELWKYVERLSKVKLPPMPSRRKAGEPLTKLPSGFVPVPENPPDLPYFIPRTRNFLLPVYYNLDSDPEKCYTIVKNVTGDLWKFEEDLRIYLEGLNNNKRRILTSVQEPDERVLFRGKHLKEVVEWLYGQGF